MREVLRGWFAPTAAGTVTRAETPPAHALHQIVVHAARSVTRQGISHPRRTSRLRSSPEASLLDISAAQRPDARRLRRLAQLLRGRADAAPQRRAMLPMPPAAQGARLPSATSRALRAVREGADNVRRSEAHPRGVPTAAAAGEVQRGVSSSGHILFPLPQPSLRARTSPRARRAGESMGMGVFSTRHGPGASGRALGERGNKIWPEVLMTARWSFCGCWCR
jgi:hypothetical protein